MLINWFYFILYLFFKHKYIYKIEDPNEDYINYYHYVEVYINLEGT